jgi:hypothetical protein
MQDTVIVGAVESGERAAVQKAIKRLIKQVETNNFDLAELLFRAKSKHLYTEPSFSDFVATLNIKPRRAQYLERIAEIMDGAGIPREEYEPIGISKLRVITRLSAVNDDGTPAMYTNPVTNESHPMVEYIVGITEQAMAGRDIKLIEKDVRILKGEVGENDMVWRNFRLPRVVDENTIAPALEKAAINIGTVATDENGLAKEVQDWRKLEVLAIEYVNDKSTDPEIS